MPQDADDDFYSRADEHIHLANDQLEREPTRGKVSASTLYAAARFNAWVSAGGFASSDQMVAARAETLDYFVEQYRLMLEENLDDYINNFSRYMGVKHDA
jgi:Protein of unknown function (DUF3144)